MSTAPRATRDDILGMTQLPWEEITLPNGKTIIVQGMTGLERDAFENTIIGRRGGKRNLDNLRARLAVRCVKDAPDGSLLFGQHDADRLGRIRADVLQKIFDAAQRLNGMSYEDLAEMGKGSGEDPTAASGSADSVSSSPRA